MEPNSPQLVTTTIKEHGSYTAVISLVYSHAGVPYRTLLRYRHAGFEKRNHARAHGNAHARNLLAYALGDYETLARARLYWEPSNRNCCPVHWMVEGLPGQYTE